MLTFILTLHKKDLCQSYWENSFSLFGFKPSERDSDIVAKPQVQQSTKVGNRGLTSGVK